MVAKDLNLCISTFQKICIKFLKSGGVNDKIKSVDHAYYQKDVKRIQQYLQKKYPLCSPIALLEGSASKSNIQRYLRNQIFLEGKLQKNQC